MKINKFIRVIFFFNKIYNINILKYIFIFKGFIENNYVF